MNNKFWVKLRRIITSLVENQKGLDGIITIINHNDHLNILFVGRNGKEKMDKLMKYVKKKFQEGIIGIELETEFIQIDQKYSGLFNLLIADGGIIAISSEDKYLITNRLNRQIERLVTSIEKLSVRMNL